MTWLCTIFLFINQNNYYETENLHVANLVVGHFYYARIAAGAKLEPYRKCRN
jgi:hypothetical protein